MSVQKAKTMDVNDMKCVAPVVPIAPWLGGKRALSKRLVALIGQIPHQAYVEPFVGMGGVFLRRHSAPSLEVVNDLSGDVANMFRVLREHRHALADLMVGQITSRSEFERLVQLDPVMLTDLQRAARFIYLQRVAFGGKVTGRNFGVTMGGARFNADKLLSALDAVGRRMAGVVIESLPFERLIPRYDRTGTLFYLDPPYLGNESDYGLGMFGRRDFHVLADLLEAMNGRFIMTLNDCSEVREIFAAFDLHPVGLSYRLSGRPTPARELVITTAGLVPFGSIT
jgi:DNA adenine methylase